MSLFELRPYQRECVDAVLAKFREYRRLLTVVPTAGGKTVIFSTLADRLQPVRTLILAHREELLAQAADKLHRATGIVAETERAESHASLDAPVVVASVQTLMREKRLGVWPPDHFGLVVVDEAHHVLADSYQRVLAHFHDHAKVLGVTATPDRGDQKNLGTYFEEVAFEIGLQDLIHQGYLSRIAVRTIPVRIDLGSVRTTAGDYNDADLGDAIEPVLREIVASLRVAIGTRKTLVFLPLVRTSRNFVKLCVEAGFAAAHIDGESVDRRELLARFAAGEFQILSNSMLLTEGFDEPSIECVICLRPTKVRALYAQIVGRGTRLHAGKENLLVLDFLWMTERHSLVRPAHLVASTPEIADAMIAQSVGAAGIEEPLDLLDAESDAKSQRESALAAEIAAHSRRTSQLLDPLELALSLHAVELADYQPTMGWHYQAATPKQLATIRQFGLDPGLVRNKGHASALLDTLFSRRSLRLATPKQVAWLRRTNHPSPQSVSFADAQRWLSDRFNRRAA